MEVAHSQPFLESKILFLSTTEFEKALKREIWLCHRNMKLPLTEIYNMTVMDRRTFIAIHNRETEKEKKELDSKFKRHK